MCKVVEDYKWSSDIYYRKNINTFINKDVIFDVLDKNVKHAINKYIDYMEKQDDEDYENMKVIGDEAYQIMCMSRKKIDERKRLDEVLSDIGVTMEEYYLIKTASRKRCLTKYKLEYIKAALELKYSNREIGEAIGITENAVKDIIARYS